ncbi:MAG: NADPH-dependent assimilatory sulfite reductase hemoprotein subunit [Cocleimonas sp.]
MSSIVKPLPKIHEQKLVEGSSEVEVAKDKGNYLRGTIETAFADQITASIPDDDTYLLKFHGTYQQDNRDLRDIRREKKLEPAYSFMTRMRVPGGELTAKQWIASDNIASNFGNNTIKLSTRQAVQFHGFIKYDLKKAIQAMDAALLDSIGGCGDVNRNVMCDPDPSNAEVHAQVFPWAKKVSEHLLPKSRAYHEIWLDEGKGEGKKRVDSAAESETEEPFSEPMYGKLYLPKKFKIGIAIPPNNDMDVYINDIAAVAIIKDNKLQGFNIAVGGGLAMTFGRDDTYPRLASDVGFVEPKKLLEVCKTVLEIQRDFGDRTDRKQGRLKYTVDRMGADNFKAMMEDRLGYKLETTKPIEFKTSADKFGWHQGSDKKWHATLFVEHGRVIDKEGSQLKTALREIAELNTCNFRLTGNQHLMLVNITEKSKEKINAILAKYQLSADASELSGMRRNAIACVALNTCPLAMAEAERYMPSLITKIDPILSKNGLFEDEIKIRMTGCPNGCGRSVMGEIGFIGKSMGKYNMYLGSSHQSDRLSKLYKENLDEAAILAELEVLLADYAVNRNQDEKFGDYVIRAEYVKETIIGLDFHD